MPTKITIPVFECSIPAITGNKHKEVESNMIQWGNKFGLITSPESGNLLLEANIGGFSGCIYPDICATNYQLSNDWFIWMLFYDKLCDSERPNPHEVLALNRRLLAILDGATVSELDNPLERALADIRDRLLAQHGIGQNFVRSVAQYFQGNLWEVVNHAGSTLPFETTYFKFRPFTGSIYILAELAHLLKQIRLTPVIRENIYLQQLLLMASNHSTWSNEIFSYVKESKDGSYINNLVYILQHERGLAVQEAIDYVTKLCNNEMRAFTQLKVSLPSLGVHMDSDVDCFVAFCEGVIRGHLDWAYETERYSK